MCSCVPVWSLLSSPTIRVVCLGSQQSCCSCHPCSSLEAMNLPAPRQDTRQAEGITNLIVLCPHPSSTTPGGPACLRGGRGQHKIRSLARSHALSILLAIVEASHRLSLQHLQAEHHPGPGQALQEGEAVKGLDKLQHIMTLINQLPGRGQRIPTSWSQW